MLLLPRSADLPHDPLLPLLPGVGVGVPLYYLRQYRKYQGQVVRRTGVGVASHSEPALDERHVRVRVEHGGSTGKAGNANACRARGRRRADQEGDRSGESVQ